MCTPRRVSSSRRPTQGVQLLGRVCEPGPAVVTEPVERSFYFDAPGLILVGFISGTSDKYPLETTVAGCPPPPRRLAPRARYKRVANLTRVPYSRRPFSQISRRRVTLSNTWRLMLAVLLAGQSSGGAPLIFGSHAARVFLFRPS